MKYKTCVIPSGLLGSPVLVCVACSAVVHRPSVHDAWHDLLPSPNPDPEETRRWDADQEQQAHHIEALEDGMPL